MLRELNDLSTSAQRVLVQTLIHKADLEVLLGGGGSLDKYTAIQMILLLQVLKRSVDFTFFPLNFKK